MAERPYILSIAGFDPSSGAGVTSDIKTFEAHGLYGLSVCTAITVQNDHAFASCHWVDESTILNQIQILLDRFHIEVVKIGIIENWQRLYNITEFLKAKVPHAKIVLDPVIKSSTDFKFHSKEDIVHFKKAMKNCYVITPNFEEIELIFPDKTLDQTINEITKHTLLYLKGGHRKEKKGWDELHGLDIPVYIEPRVDSVYDKHGSGCVLSSALASNIALGYDVENAGNLAKYYTEEFLNSNEDVLGFHNYHVQN